MLRLMRDYATSWMIKFILGAIVVVFVFWGVGSFTAQKANRIAVVNGEGIEVETYREAYNNLIEQLRQQFGSSLNAETMKLLQVEKQALDGLINQKLMLQEAARLGFRVSDEELAAAIRDIGAFQTGGAFDSGLYQRALARAGIKPERFEQQQKELMLTRKMQAFILDSVKVVDPEALEMYNWQNATVDLDFVRFDPERYTAETPSDDDLAAYFEENKENYKTDPQRKVRYLFFDPKVYAAQVTVADDELAAFYESNAEQFRQAQTVEARHILFKVDADASEETVAAARQKAEEVLVMARGGQDFADLARQYSEGPTRENGGYLGAFERDRMVKPFADKAFAMQAGEISDPVRTRFGWHLIKVEKVNPARLRTLEEVRDEIRKRLTDQRAKNLAFDQAEVLLDAVYEGDDLEQTAAAQKLTAVTTDFFTRQGPEKGVANRSQFAAVAFGLAEKDISDIQDLGDGYYILQVVETRAAQVPALEAVRAKVSEDLVQSRKAAQARSAAEALLGSLKAGTTLAEAAAQLGLEVAATGPFKRDATIPEIGYESQIVEAAFQLSADNPLPEQVFEGAEGVYVVRLRERKLPDAEGFEQQKEGIRSSLLQQKQNQAFEAWLTQLKEKSEITIDPTFIQ